MAANAPALAQKGQTEADTAQLQDLYNGLVCTVADRGTGQSTSRLLTQDNLGVVNAFAGSSASVSSPPGRAPSVASS